MENDDIDKLAIILADQATSSLDTPKAFFRNLVKNANLPKEWLYEIVDSWMANPADNARNLIKWALEKGINTQEPEFTTLGSILHPLLQNLGLEQLQFVIELMIRCNLYEDKKPLIKSLIDHPNLQNVFNEKNIPILTLYATHLLKHDQNPLSSQLIENLTQIFRQVNPFALVVQSFLATFDNPDQVGTHCSDELAILKNAQTNISFGIFILFKLLLEDYPSPNNRIQRVLDFCGYLQRESSEIRDQLKSWLQAVRQRYGYQALPKTETAKADTLDAYLMVIIRPVKGQRSKFRINGFLKIGQSSGRWIDTDVKHQALKALNYDNNSCSLNQVKNYFAQLMLKTVELVRAEKIKLDCNDYLVTIEFFMPVTYLSEEVDCWKIPYVDEELTIGKEFRISIRFYERIAYEIGEPDYVEGAILLLEPLESKWGILQQFLAEKPDLQTIKNKFACLCQKNQLQDYSLLKDKIGLKLACTPPQPKKEREKFLNTILKKGIPIALWMKRDEILGIENLEQTTDNFLRQDYLANFNLLLRERMEQYDSLGKHLAILYDDPYRLPSRPSLGSSDPLPTDNQIARRNHE
jgi:hypothetical protein